jgi:3-oxoacyl-[acyl-carrier protein] reductase
MPRKTAIVTGAARGIGRAIALALARHGMDLALVDLRAEQLAETAAAARALGVRAEPLICDVAGYQAVRACVAEIAAAFGRIDVLVNNAAMLQPKRLHEITEAEWDAGSAANFKSVFSFIQAAAPVMRQGGGGRIVNISSVSANTGGSATGASRFAYAATKAGVLGLTRALAKELAPSILVNAVCPGSILTDRTRDSFAGHLDAIAAETPLGRVGTPEDIAVVVAFLCTAEPLFMTGEVIDVDGGANIN